ncbi:hypothetical protein [Trueperella sp. LYQ143]|uniref:DUF7455 domain-containing protein n=1 Tax=unclassified Trueperella TaxID=2630174 RepID=UPI003983C381
MKQTRIDIHAYIYYVNAVVETPQLTATDRCDACHAQAYVRVELASGELFFCAHHAREHRASLEKVAIRIIDETGRIDAE